MVIKEHRDEEAGQPKCEAKQQQQGKLLNVILQKVSAKPEGAGPQLLLCPLGCSCSVLQTISLSDTLPCPISWPCGSIL